MSDYPSTIVTFREKANLPGMTYDEDDKRTLYVEDLQKIENEVIAIEEVLGEEVQGDYPTLVDRLNAAGGGGQTIYDAIVASSGGDYTTVGAAIADGKVNIFVMPGTYAENDISIYGSGVRIQGAGYENSKLTFASNKKLEMIGANNRISALGFTFSGGSSSIGGIHIEADNCSLDMCNLECGTANNALLTVLGNNATISDCRFANSFNSTNSIVKCSNGYSAIHCTFRNCTFEHKAAYTDGMVYVQIDYSRLINCTFICNSGNTGAGRSLHILGPSEVVSCNFLSYGSDNQTAIYAQAGRTSVLDCKITDYGIGILCGSGESLINSNIITQEGRTTPRGITISSSKNVVNGNIIRGKSSSLAGDGINIGAFDDNIINGNTISGYANGINISSASADRTLVVANNYYSNTGGISDSGTASTISNNVG